MCHSDRLLSSGSNSKWGEMLITETVFIKVDMLCIKQISVEKVSDWRQQKGCKCCVYVYVPLFGKELRWHICERERNTELDSLSNNPIKVFPS